MTEKKQVELSEWEKSQRENLNDTKVFALDEVRAAGGAHNWVKVDIHGAVRNALVKYGYLETKHGLYRLTEEGLNKINEEMDEDPPEGYEPELTAPDWELPMPHELPTVKPFVGTEADSVGKGYVGFDDPLPPFDFGEKEVDALEHCDTCAGCVDHEILHMLAQKYPAIARLRQTVLETRRLMDELGIQPK